LLVSVGQNTRQRINYFYVNEAISMSEHRVPIFAKWQWYLLQHTVYCSHITLFTDLGIGDPLNVGGPWLQPSQHPP